MSYSRLISQTPRGVGKTQAIIEATQKLGGVMICTTKAEADRIAKEHGIQTLSCTQPAERLLGSNLPVLFDPDAVARLLDKETNSKDKWKALALIAVGMIPSKSSDQYIARLSQLEREGN